MTAAFVHLTGSAMRSRWRGFLTLLAVVLPVPLFAALGLSLPLPATVERIAAKLVPFGNAEILESRASAGRASDGTIVLVPGEARSAGGSGTSAASAPSGLSIGAAAGRPGTAEAPRGERVPGGAQTEAEPSSASAATDRGNAPTATDGKEAPAGGSTTTPTEEEPPPGGGSDPAPSPGVVDTATNTANGVVNTAADATGSATDTVTNTTTTAANTAQDAAGGLLPP